MLNTVVSLLMQITTVICGFILPQLMLEHYGSNANGLVQSISQFLSIITFMELGVGQVIQTSLYRPLAEGDHVQISKVLRSGTIYFHKIVCAFLAYVVVLSVVFPHIVKNQYDWLYIAMLIGAMSVSAFSQYGFALIDKILLSADQKGYIQYTVHIAATIANTAIAVVLIRRECPIQLVKAGSAAVFLLSPLVIRWYINKNYQIDRKIKYDEEPVKQKWNGVAQHISTVVLEGTDNIVLTLFSTLSNVSVYSVYIMVISGIRQFYTAATAGIQSMVGALWAKRETEKLNNTFAAVEVILHYVVVFLFSCIGILIVPFVRVYTNGLVDANYIQPAFAAVITLAYAIRCLRTPYNIMILAGGHYKQTQKCHIWAAALNLSISILAVSLWGLVGIAIGTLAAMAYQTLWMMAYNSRNLLCWPFRKIAKQLAADALTAAAIMIATYWLELQTVSYWGWLCLAVPVALIALGITVGSAFLFFRKELIVLIRSLTRKR